MACQLDSWVLDHGTLSRPPVYTTVNLIITEILNPSMRFSRQKYWSGVLLPSPIYALPCVK